MRHFHVPALVLMSIAASVLVHTALPAQMQERSDARAFRRSAATAAFSRALSVADEEALGYDPETWEVSVSRRGGAWKFNFEELPEEGKAVAAGSHFTLTVYDDGQVTVFKGL